MKWSYTEILIMLALLLIVILNLSKPERTGTGVMDVAIGAPETKQAS